MVSLYGHAKWQAAALLQAGKCHELKGEWTEAMRLYAQLLKDYPDAIVVDIEEVYE